MPEFRRFFQCAALAVTVAVAGAATPNVAMAQSAATDSASTMNRTTNTDDNDGFDMGWLGLLGLAGLLGLRRRNDHTVHHTDTTTRRP